jgi:hypothetical protein
MAVMPDSAALLQRMREVLGKLIQLSDMSRVEIGERLGGGPHLVRRILSGDSELKARHILEIAELIGIRPIEFFHIVFEDKPGAPSPLIQKMGDMAAELDAYRTGALGGGQAAVARPKARPGARPPARPRRKRVVGGGKAGARSKRPG